nr:hypothetical protein [Tanacetum cinerariifolium]
MYLHFIQLIIQAQVGDLSTHTTRFISPALTQKVFANMRRVGKGFSGVETPLFEGMIVDRQPAEEELGAEQVQVDAAVAATVVEDVVEDVAEDVAHGEAFTATFQQVLDTCYALLRHVEHLEHDNVAQRLEIVKLEARVKKLEKTDKIKSLKFRRLRKVGASRQVGSSDDMEDVFNQGRMMNEDEMIDATSATIPAVSVTIPAAAPTVVAAYIRRRKGVIIRDPEEELSLKTTVETPTKTPKVKNKGKGIMVEAPKPMKKKNQIEMDVEYARKLQEEIDRDHDGFNKDVYWDAAVDHVNQKSSTRFDENIMFLFKSREEIEAEDQEIIKSINETPAQKAAKRRKLSEEAQKAKDLKKRLEVVEDEDDDVFVKATPLASKLVNVTRLQVEEESKMSLELLRFTRQQ